MTQPAAPVLDRLRSHAARAATDPQHHLLSLGLRPAEAAEIVAAVDAERSRADREGDRAVELIGERVTLMLQLDDAKRALKAAEAARDAALARALPAPVLMETVEQVQALADGQYLVWPPGAKTPHLWTRSAHEAWGLEGARISGPLPDLPIPMPTQEG